MANWFENYHNSKPNAEPFYDQKVMVDFKQQQTPTSQKAMSDMLRTYYRHIHKHN